MRKTTKRTLAVAATAVLLFGGAGAAYAYWTATGTGTGTGTTAAGSAVTVVQTSVVSNLAPDSTPQALSGTITNPSDAPVVISGITAAVTSTSNPLCLTSWFAIAGTITFPAQIAVDDTSAWSGATVQLVNNPAVNQNACKTATITITYTVS